MSIASEIERIQTNVTNSLDAVASYGVEVPEGANSNDLPEAINNIGTKIPTKTSQLENDSGFLTEVPEETMIIMAASSNGVISFDKSYEVIERAIYAGVLCYVKYDSDIYYCINSMFRSNYSEITFCTPISASGAIKELDISPSEKVEYHIYYYAKQSETHMHKVMIIKLLKDAWNASTKQQNAVVSFAGTNDGALINVYPYTDKENIKAIQGSCILCVKEEGQLLTFEAEKIPSVDVSFVIEGRPMDILSTSTFYILNRDTNVTTTLQFREGLSWTDWVESEFNTIGAGISAVNTVVIDGHELHYVKTDGSITDNAVNSYDNVVANATYSYEKYGASAPD